MEKISIIVPIYNVAPYLPACLDSIIHQTYLNLEIILVDDGSPDRSGEICDEYAKKDKRVKVIHQSNGGLSDARNTALDIAKGDYLMFVDSDDWIEKKTCEILNRLASDYKADTVIFGLNFVFDSGKVIRSKRGMAGLTDKNMCMKYLIHNVARGGIFNYACNKMFSSHLFEGLRFPVGRLAEDQDVIYKLIHRSQRIYVTEQPLYNYYQRDGSITAAQYYPRLIRDRHELWLKRLDFIREYYPDLENYQIAQILGAAYVGIVKLEGNKQNGELKKKLICFSNKYILKEKVKADLLTHKEEDAENKYLDELIGKAVENLEVEINPEIIEDEKERMIDDYRRELSMQGISLEQYLEFTKGNLETLKKNIEPQAVARIKTRYLLEGVVEKENLTVTDDEVKAEVKRLAEMYGTTEEEITTHIGDSEVIGYDLKMRKALDFLKEN